MAQPHIGARPNNAQSLHKPLPSQDVLSRFFFYNPTTGDLVNIEDRGHAKAGQPAGYIEPSRAGKKYRRISLAGERYYAHAVIVTLQGIAIPPGKEIDHRNGDGTDNKWKNLRFVTHAGNMRNRNATEAQMELFPA